MGLFDDLFKKKGISEKTNHSGKEYEVNPDAMAFSQEGLNDYQRQNYRSTVVNFNRAIDAQSSNQNFYIMRGTSYEDMGDDVAAAKDFVKTLELQPSSSIAAYRLGMIYLRNKDFENAVKWLNISFNNSPDSDLTHLNVSDDSMFFVHKKLISGNLGFCLTVLDRFGEGFKHLDEAILMDPEYANPYMSKGMALIKMGKNKDAVKYLKKAVELGQPQANMALQMLEKFEGQEETEEEKQNLDLDFTFVSSDHLRYENGEHVSGPYGSAQRTIKVEANVSGNEGYTVSVYNTEAVQATLQMAPKQMKLVEVNNKKIQLKGFGKDSMGSSFADYGLTIFHDDGSVEKCILHMYDRSVDIEYQR